MRHALAGGIFSSLLAVMIAWGLTASASAPSEGSGEPSRGTVSTPRQRYVVAAVGDSLTDARSHGGKFLTYLHDRCPESQFDNYGRGAEMVNQMRRRFARDVLGPDKPGYTHVIIFGGVNDLYSDLTAKRTPAKIERDLQQMYDLAHEHGIRVIALTVAPWGGFTRYYNAHRGETTLEVNRWIFDQQKLGKIEHAIDAYGLLSCGDAERLCPRFVKPFNDGIHFNTDGHNVLGEALHRAVFANCR
jgi:lysophospholipase L1-like esterase